MSMPEHKEMYTRWMAMWNTGDLGLADQLVDPDCIVHQAGVETVRGPEGIKQMVRQGREPFETLTFTIAVGPIAEDDLLSARWTSHGTYKGGIPGATALPGTAIRFGGIDIWRIRSGKIVEYWVSSDGLHLMNQLGAASQ